MNNINNNDSLYIILNQYKKEHITEEEAVQLIGDLYRNQTTYFPVYPTWPQVTYEQQTYKTYEVTCKQ